MKRILDFFKKKEPTKEINHDNLFKDNIVDPNNTEDYLSRFNTTLEDYDESKKSLLILDDNAGVLSFLEDDLISILEELKIDRKEYNILKFGGEYAVFNLKNVLKNYKDIDAILGIFDITIGGAVYDQNEGNIIYDGVDAFISVKERSPNLEYVFFTGNKLNPDIKKNKEILRKFKETTSLDISTHLMNKTSFSPKHRRNKIKELLVKAITNIKE